jgi:hypothetical protein
MSLNGVVSFEGQAYIVSVLGAVPSIQGVHFIVSLCTQLSQEALADGQLTSAFAPQFNLPRFIKRLKRSQLLLDAGFLCDTAP